MINKLVHPYSEKFIDKNKWAICQAWAEMLAKATVCWVFSSTQPCRLRWTPNLSSPFTWLTLLSPILVTVWDPTHSIHVPGKLLSKANPYKQLAWSWAEDFLKTSQRSINPKQTVTGLGMPCIYCQMAPSPAIVLADLISQHNLIWVPLSPEREATKWRSLYSFYQVALGWPQGVPDLGLY